MTLRFRNNNKMTPQNNDDSLLDSERPRLVTSLPDVFRHFIPDATNFTATRRGKCRMFINAKINTSSGNCLLKFKI